MDQGHNAKCAEITWDSCGSIVVLFLMAINILEESISLHRLTCHSKHVKQLECSHSNLNKLNLISGTSHMPCTGICYFGRRKKE